MGRNVGHLSMQLSDGTYISYWHEETLIMKKKRSGTQTYQDDVQAEGRVADQILTLPEDIVDQAAIKSWWSTYTDNNKYHLLIRNYASEVTEPRQAATS